MQLVPCPHCGPREQGEFVCLGEAPAHPIVPENLARALYGRVNAKGIAVELWWHRHGCRQWLRLTRDSATNRFAP
jgi:sarcosine oxidase, subunit delta